MTSLNPAFWRAGAMSSLTIMIVVLIILTLDTLKAISAGGSHVPDYTVINQTIGYRYDAVAAHDVPTISGSEPLFGQTYSSADAAAIVRQGKLVIQSRACMDCHTFFGNGAYYAPDLTKAWLDPVWASMWVPMTGARTKADAMVAFLMSPERYVTWRRQMPNLHLSKAEAQSVVAYLKWLSAVDTNGFPNNFAVLPEGRQ